MTRWASVEDVSGAMTGDEAARDRLVHVIWPACFRLAAAIIGDRHLAQDAAQEACVIVYRKVQRLRKAGAFDAWLYRIVMREAARARRRFQIGNPLSLASEASSSDASFIDVWRALADLPPELRDVVVLFYFDDLKSEAIATALGVPHATVRTRLMRARERLRILLGDDDDEKLRIAHGEIQQHAF